MTRPVVRDPNAERITTTTACGGATVTAIHHPDTCTIEVKCTRHLRPVTITYSATATPGEVHAYCRYASLFAQSHAATCTKRAGR